MQKKSNSLFHITRTRSLKSTHWQGSASSSDSGKESFHAFSSFCELQTSPSCWLQTSLLCPLSSHAISSFVCVSSQISLCFSFKRTFVIGYKTYENNPERFSQLKILKLIILAKILFPNKITFFQQIFIFPNFGSQDM